ncbi:MAG: protein-disulfide reductase DsbD N-terminal domain-containing protein [Planctomycetota bacterium]
MPALASDISTPVPASRPHNLLLACVCALSASAAIAADDDDFRATPAIITEHETLVAGQPGWVAVTFEIDEGWHMYWPGQNDSGFAPIIDITADEGVGVGDFVWPSPTRYQPARGLLDHIFEDRLTVMMPVTPPASAAGSTITLALDMEWLVCEELCIPEFAGLEQTIRVAEPAEPAETSEPSKTSDAEHFAAARRLVPEPIEPKENDPNVLADGDVTIRLLADVLTINAPGAASIAFFPSADGRTAERILRDGYADGETLRMRFDAGNEPVLGVTEIHMSKDAEPKRYSVRIETTAD